jgi:hypothetical protein
MVFWLFIWLIMFTILKEAFLLAFRAIRNKILRRQQLKGAQSTKSYMLVDNTMEPFIEDTVHKKKKFIFF